MSAPYLRFYVDKDLDGLANKILKDPEFAVLCKIKMLAVHTSTREGFLEWATGMPMTNNEIAKRIKSQLRLVNTTIDKCLKYKLLERIDNVLHVVDWEVDQLSKTQRAQIHKAVELGKHKVEVADGKPLNKDFMRGQR